MREFCRDLLSVVKEAVQHVSLKQRLSLGKNFFYSSIITLLVGLKFFLFLLNLVILNILVAV